MGMSILVCNLCNEGFTEYEEYGHCATCEEQLCESCLDEMIEKHGIVDEDSDFADNWGANNPKTCDICTGVKIQETLFVNFLIKKIGETRATLEDAFRSSLKEAQTV